LSDLGRHELLESIGLLLQESHGFRDEGEELFVGDGLGEIAILSDLPKQVDPVFGESGELLDHRVRQGQRLGREGLGEVHQGAGIDPVGLGKAAFGAGEIAHLPGVEAGDGQPGRVSQGKEQEFITAAGFTDQEDVGGQRFDPGAQGGWRVGNTLGSVEMMDVEMEFGDVDTEIGLHR